MESNGLIAQDVLDALSYRSTLAQSLKQISLRRTPLEIILQDIAQYRESYINTLIMENLIGSRFKSDDSILRKYEKTLRTGGVFKQCFNDVLGFRLRLNTYPSEFPDYFRIADLRNGKQTDDGYRAIHLYYQRDSHSYPIEIQLWCGQDYWFNIWSHQYVYKYRSAKVGRALYQEYCAGKITTEQEFQARMIQEVQNRGGQNDLCCGKGL